MARVKGGVVHARRRKKILKQAKGFVGGPGTIYRAAIEFTRRAGVYAYRDRRQKKRHFRALWIVRLNAACKERGIAYSRFMHAVSAANVMLNRKMLSELAISDPTAFDAIVEKIRPFIQSPAAA